VRNFSQELGSNVGYDLLENCYKQFVNCFFAYSILEQDGVYKMTKEEPKKVSQINSSKNGLKLVMLGVIVVQVLLIIATYNFLIEGLNNLAQFLLGINLLVFATLFVLYKYGMSNQR